MKTPLELLRSFIGLFRSQKDKSLEDKLSEDFDAVELSDQETNLNNPDALGYLKSILERSAEHRGKTNAQFVTHATKQELGQLKQYIENQKINPSNLSTETANMIFACDPGIARLFMENGLDPNIRVQHIGRLFSASAANAARPDFLVTLNNAQRETDFDISADMSTEVTPALSGAISQGRESQAYIIPFLTKECQVNLKQQYSYLDKPLESLLELTSYNGSASAVKEMVREGAKVTPKFLTETLDGTEGQTNMRGRGFCDPQALVLMAIYESSKKAAIESAQNYPAKLSHYPPYPNSSPDIKLKEAVKYCDFNQLITSTNKSYWKRNDPKILVNNTDVDIYKIILSLDVIQELGHDISAKELLQEACKVKDSQEYRDILVQYLLNIQLQKEFENWVQNNPGEERKFDLMSTARKIVKENNLLESAIESGNAALVNYLAHSTGIEITEEHAELASKCIEDETVVEEQRVFSDKKIQLIAKFADMYDQHLKENLDFIIETRNENALDTLYRVLNNNWEVLAAYYSSSRSSEGVLEVIQTKLLEKQIEEAVQQKSPNEQLYYASQDLLNITEDLIETTIKDTEIVGGLLTMLQDDKQAPLMALSGVEIACIEMENTLKEKIEHLESVAKQYTKFFLDSKRKYDQEIINDIYQNIKQTVELAKKENCKPLARLISSIQSKQNEISSKNKALEVTSLSAESSHGYYNIAPEEDSDYIDMQGEHGYSNVALKEDSDYNVPEERGYYNVSGHNTSEKITGLDDNFPSEEEGLYEDVETKDERIYEDVETKSMMESKRALEALETMSKKTDKLLRVILNKSIALSISGQKNQKNREKIDELYEQVSALKHTGLENIKTEILKLKDIEVTSLMTKIANHITVMSEIIPKLETLVVSDNVLRQHFINITDGIIINFDDLQRELKIHTLNKQLTNTKQSIVYKLSEIHDFLMSKALEEGELLVATKSANDDYFEQYQEIDWSQHTPGETLELQCVKKGKIANHDAIQFHYSLYDQMASYVDMITEEVLISDDKVMEKDIEELISSTIPRGNLLEDPEALLKSLNNVISKHKVLKDRQMKNSQNTNVSLNEFDSVSDVMKPKETRILEKKVRLARQAAISTPKESKFFINFVQAYDTLVSTENKTGQQTKGKDNLVQKSKSKKNKKDESVQTDRGGDIKEFLNKINMRRAFKDVIDQATNTAQKCSSTALKSDPALLNKLNNVLKQLKECRKRASTFGKGSLELSLEECEEIANGVIKIPITKLQILEKCLMARSVDSFANSLLDSIEKDLSDILSITNDQDLTKAKSSSHLPKHTDKTQRYGKAVAQQLEASIDGISEVALGDTKIDVEESSGYTAPKKKIDTARSKSHIANKDRPLPSIPTGTPGAGATR